VPNLVLAYIDPGAGSVALQLLLAGLTGVAVVARTVVRRIRERIQKRRAPKAPPDAQT
jgi:hypothetical protein